MSVPMKVRRSFALVLALSLLLLPGAALGAKEACRFDAVWDGPSLDLSLRHFTETASKGDYVTVRSLSGNYYFGQFVGIENNPRGPRVVLKDPVTGRHDSLKASRLDFSQVQRAPPPDALRGVGGGDLVSLRERSRTAHTGRILGYTDDNHILFLEQEERQPRRLSPLDFDFALQPPQIVARDLPPVLFYPGAVAPLEFPSGPALPEQTPRNALELRTLLNKYMPKDSASYWYDYAREHRGPSLGGNSEGAYQVNFPDGRTAVSKTFNFNPRDAKAIDRAYQTVRQMERWADEGKGPRVLGVGLNVDATRAWNSLTVVMENIRARANEYGTELASGTGADTAALRGFSREARIWVRDKMVGGLRVHPDGHPRNVMFRVTQLSDSRKVPLHGGFFRDGSLLFEVLLIDGNGYEADPNSSIRTADPSTLPPVAAQYNPVWQTAFLNRQMGL